MSTMTVVAVPDQSSRQYSHLVSTTLWDRLVARVVKDHGFDEDTATAVIDGALGFLQLCASHPGTQFSPSEMVDLGWHTFILHTRDYHEFCMRHAGRFIHHDPDDDLSPLGEGPQAAATVAFMRKHEIPFHERLWQVSARCSGDGSGACRYLG